MHDGQTGHVRPGLDPAAQFEAAHVRQVHVDEGHVGQDPPAQPCVEFDERLVAGGDGDDLVTGTAQQGEADEGPGYVTLFAGSRAGLRPGRRITQASRGVPGTNELEDRFGAAVALADVDRDGHADLVVGAPGEDRGAGRVTFLRGARSGVARTGARAWDQGTRGVPGTKERFDAFGARVALLDHDGDRRLDLDVVATGEDAFRGSVTTLPGVRGGFTTRHAQATFLERRGRDSNPR